MKRLIISIALVTMFLSCKAQSYFNDYIEMCFSIIKSDMATYMDSIVSDYEERIANLQGLVDDMNESPVLYGDQDIFIYDSTGVVTELKRANGNQRLSIIENEKRLQMFVIDDYLQVWIADSTKSELLVNINYKVLQDNIE